MKRKKEWADLVVEAVLEKCIGIYKGICKETENLDEKTYGRFPSAAYIEQQITVPGKTKLSSIRNTINIWKYEKEELSAMKSMVQIPDPVISKMYFNRAHFVFEIMDKKVRVEYYFGPRYGRCMEFDIMESDNVVQLTCERHIWVS